MRRVVTFVVLLACVLSLKNSVHCQYIPCQRRDFGESSFVCECSTNYCDEFVNDNQFDVSPGRFKQYTSDKWKKRFSLVEGNLIDKKSLDDAELRMQLDPNITYQTIKGFGAALSDSASYHLHNMGRLGLRSKALNSYFSSSTGIGFTFARLPIGGTDFSTRSYTLDDVNDDFDLKHFALSEEDTIYKIPAIKELIDITKGKLRLFATPWTAPGWLKANGNITGGAPLKGKAGDKYHKTWANYLSKFVDEYEARGVKIWGITVQNEPFLGLLLSKDIMPVPLLGYTPEQERDFIKKDLGPLMKQRHPHLKIMAFDGLRLFLDRWAKIVLTDQDASGYISGIAHHWYTDEMMPVNVMDVVHRLSSDKFIIGTEACNGVKAVHKGVLLGSWERGEKYSSSIIEDLNHWNVGWLSWNLVLDTHGGPSWLKNYVDASVIIDYDKKVFYKQPMFYHFGHVSRFVTPGSKRISFQMTQNKYVKSTAFKSPNDALVVVLLNTDTISYKINICGNNRQCIQSEIGPRSIHSFVFKE